METPILAGSGEGASAEFVDGLTPYAARLILAEQLVAHGFITRPEVAAAFRAVPRHLFVPAGTTVAAAYGNNNVVVKQDTDGRTTSSTTAPSLQAYMLQAAALEPGSRVLEIGSGGCNAALIAEIVGPSGVVTSIDIDADVVGMARASLGLAGYPDVRVEQADAEYGYPAGGPYDAIIVTVEASDIPPAWRRQLGPGGRLVVPLRMRGNTRCLTLARRGDDLVATAAILCRFVSMQGDGAEPVRHVRLRGDDIVLSVDDVAAAVDEEALGAAFAWPRVQRWSAVTVGIPESADSLHLWLASQPRPFGQLAVARDRTRELLDPQNDVVCPTFYSADSVAYLASRQVEPERWEFGAHGYGPDGERLAGDMAELIGVWDRRHRHNGDPRITVHPSGTVLPAPDGPRLLMRRRHALITVTWTGAVDR